MRNSWNFSSQSRLGLGNSYYRSLGLVSVSKKHFTEVSVSSRSRKIILRKSRYRLSLEISIKPGLGLVLGLEISIKPSLGLVSVSKNVVSSNSDRNPLLLATLLLISVFWCASCAASAWSKNQQRYIIDNAHVLLPADVCPNLIIWVTTFCPKTANLCEPHYKVRIILL